MFAYFERIIPPFPEQEPVQPPGSLIQFCLHYTKGMWRPIILLSLFSAAVAIAEASLFGLMGWLVDWLATVNPETIFKEHASILVGLSVFILLVVPALILITSMLLNQAILANYPMSVRWLAHRYLLRQSLSFYQNDYAGRSLPRLCRRRWQCATP